MTYRQFNAWCEAGIGVVAAAYYAWRGPAAVTRESLFHLIVPLMVVAFFLVIVVAVVRALTHRIEDDERDRLVHAKALRNAYFVCCAGAALAMAYLILPAEMWPSAWIAPDLLSAHLLAATLIACFLTVPVSQLFFYRQQS